MDYKEIYESWLSDPYFDEETKAELRAIADDDHEIRERFFAPLKFGTAGLRGILGAGINRMNVYTVRKATQGLANYILSQHGEEKGVAIAYDSRHFSPEFADEAALCLAANGIRAYVFDALRPTPELSFAIRYLGCVSGINVTASHNKPQYNGYKVYWEDGAQITPPHDTGIMDEVLAVTDWAMVKTMSKDEAVSAGLYRVIGSEIDDAFIAEIKAHVLHPEAIASHGKDLKIVYTPLHGTGNIPARRILRELGFEQVYVVPEQELPDGNFPTVSYPNPEADEAFDLALKLAQAYRNSSNFTQTERTLVNAIYASPDDTRLYVALSKVYVEQDKLMDAQQMLDKTESTLKDGGVPVFRAPVNFEPELPEEPMSLSDKIKENAQNEEEKLKKKKLSCR